MKPISKKSSYTYTNTYTNTNSTNPSTSSYNQNKQPQYDHIMKMIIIGDSGVGKSSLLYRYQQNKFLQNYLMTIGLNYVWKIQQIDDIKIKLQIWDTAGQQKYKTITQNYYKNSDGAIISFSIDSRDSFTSVRNWIGQLTDTVKQNTQILLVGTKCDLIQQRQIQQQQAIQFAKQNNLQYMQCSAKSGQSVNQVFHKLTTMMKKFLIDQKIREYDLNKDKQKDNDNQKKGVVKLIRSRALGIHSRCCNNN